MGSTGNPNPWPPYNTYRDCSLGICSLYCPQWCYINVVPPPPPSDEGTYFSPLVIAVIGILASAFLLVTYYTLVTKYCWRRRGEHHQDDQISDDALIGTTNEASRQINGGSAGGLDESIVKSITVYKYRKGEGLVDGTDCSVCLSEFEENENLRLLPKCNHAFHLPCIDTWLKSHSSCPLCRLNIASLGALPPSQPSRAAPHRSQAAAAALTVNSHAYCHLADAPVLVIHDDQSLLVRDEAVISIFWDGGVLPSSKGRTPCKSEGADERVQVQVQVGQDATCDQGIMRRSVSLNSSASRCCGASTSDYRHGHQIRNNYANVQPSIRIVGSAGPDTGRESNDTIWTDNNNFLYESPSEMKRSISTGRFVKNSVLPG